MGEILEQSYDDEIEDGRWIEFFDAGGRGFAQPDFFLLRPESVVCFEVKLKQRPEAYSQISLLYRPLLHHIFRRPVVGVVVCRYLTPGLGGDRICHPGDVARIHADKLFTWHVT